MLVLMPVLITMNNIIVTGSNGQLGKSLQAEAKTHSQLIINCAAHTGVDKAESEPELAGAINHLAVQQLAKNAKQQHAKLIHISTDYVFNGQQYRPYIEQDEVDPQGVYGGTKLAGEQAVLQSMAEDALIIRTSWVYSEFGNNFVKTMLKLGADRESLGIIYDQVGTPTYAGDLAKAIMHIVGHESFTKSAFASQIYHYSNEGVCSWYALQKQYLRMRASSVMFQPLKQKTTQHPQNAHITVC